MGDVVAECEDGAARLILTDARVWKLKLNLQSRSSDEWQRSSGLWLLTGSDQTLRSAAGLGRWCVRVCSHIRWDLYDQWNVLWMFQRIKYLPNILQVTFKKKTPVLVMRPNRTHLSLLPAVMTHSTPQAPRGVKTHVRNRPCFIIVVSVAKLAVMQQICQSRFLDYNFTIRFVPQLLENNCLLHIHTYILSIIFILILFCQ